MVQTNEDTVSETPVTTIQQGKWKKKVAKNSDDMVTLTKSQLRAILEAIGQIGQSGALNLSDFQNQQLSHDGSRIATAHEDLARESVSQCSRCTQDSTGGRSQDAISCPSSSDTSIGVAKRDISQESVISQSSILHRRPTPVSRLEQKRQQWEKERAEMQEWNPWGKPGAGAPRKRNLISSVLSKNDSQVVVMHSTSNSSYDTPARSCVSSLLPAYISTYGTPQGSQSPNLTAISQSLVKPVESSLPFSQGSIDEIEERKQQWFQELERQRDEERHHNFSRNLDVISVGDQKTENGSHSAYLLNDSQTHMTEGRIFLRGQGLTVDPEEAAKAQERRQKALDYQIEVRKQMEEKKQKEREEKERKILEEQEEERRLQEERARMQIEYEEEQCRQREKEEKEEKKRKVLIAAMEEAQAAAEAAKKASKAQRVQQSNLNVPIQNTVETEAVIASNTNIEKITVEEDKGRTATRSHQQTAMVYPTVQSDSTINLYPQQHREFAVQTTFTSEPSGYIENRILTPTIVRMREKQRSQNKEFGTQTDFKFANQFIADDCDSAVSTSSSLTSLATCRKNRIQHSKPTKASQKNYEQPQHQPKWGVSLQQKTFVKMSERDPYYPKRKKLLELRRQHWEREMASQRALAETKKSILLQHLPNKTFSKSTKIITSSEGSLSSSEAEEKYLKLNVRPVLRRASHCRYSHGSADDVGKMEEKENDRSCYSDSPHSVLKYPSRLTQSSDNLLSSYSGSWPIATSSRSFSFPDGYPHHPSMRKKWHSQETFSPQTPVLQSCSSPPVPALQKRLELKYSPGIMYHVPRRKWSDQEGYKLENMMPSNTKQNVIPHNGNENGGGDGEKPEGDPLVHPEIITRRPTPRQDKILMQLSSLRQGLLLKQRELENLIRHPTYETS